MHKVATIGARAQGRHLMRASAVRTSPQLSMAATHAPLLARWRRMARRVRLVSKKRLGWDVSWPPMQVQRVRIHEEADQTSYVEGQHCGVGIPAIAANTEATEIHSCIVRGE